jgi:hypothetical protein
VATASSNKAKDIKRLWLFVVIVLGLPAIGSQFLSERKHFHRDPIAALRAKPPTLILIGDSMLDSRIDKHLLEDRLGNNTRVELLWNGGASSAAWYLMLKNYVVASGIRPRQCCIFFRDRMLTAPSFRTTGIFRSYLEELMRGDEPVMRTVLGPTSFPEENWFIRTINWIYPVNSRRRTYQEGIQRMMFRVAAANTSAADLERLTNRTFNVAKMRGEMIAEATNFDEIQNTRFDPRPEQSFLPHIVDAAAKSGIRLCFVRVRRHPDADGQTRQSDALRLYIQELRIWLENRHCRFIDDIDDPSFTPDMYLKAKDDHIGPWAKKRSTEIYAEKLRPLLAP